MAVFNGCILCGNLQVKAERLHGRSGGVRAAWFRECNVCGQYGITMALEEDIQIDPAAFEHWLPGLRSYTRRASAPRNVVELTTTNYTQLAAAHLHTSVATKLRLVLEYFGAKSKFAGDAVRVEPYDYPLFDVADNSHVAFLLTTLSAAPTRLVAGVVRSAQ